MSGLRFKDKVALITGGSRGMGKGTAEIFVQEGAKVVFCSNDEAEGKSTEAELNQLGPGQALFVFCELSKEDDIKQLVDMAVKTYGCIDCLINNAGIRFLLLPIEQVSAEDMRKVMDVNVVACFLMCKYTLPHLRKTKGSVIIIGSLVTLLGERDSVIYGASKGALQAMSKCLAVDEAKHGVRVNIILPGNIWTPMWESAANTFPDPQKEIESGKQVQVLGRFGTPQEIGKACLYLAADATFSTGSEMIVSGGAELDFCQKNQIQE